MPDNEIYQKIKSRWDTIAKPLDGMGTFERLIARIGAVQQTTEPDISRRCVLAFCADNGIVEEGVSQSGQDVTFQVASWMGKNESSVCRLAVPAKADVIPVDVGINSDITPEGVLNYKVAKGTKNFLKEPSMTKEECRKAIDIGIQLVKDCRDKGYKIIATGEMGIGNTTTSAAIAEILFDPEYEYCKDTKAKAEAKVEAKPCGLKYHEEAGGISEYYGNPECLTEESDSVSYVGRGSGLDDHKLDRKRQVVKEAVKLYRDCKPFELLCSVGGFDIAAMTGAFIGGAKYHVPIIIDGAISSIAAVMAEFLSPGTKECMIPSHIGKEPVTEAALKFLGLNELAVIRAGMALGEGTGAVMLFPLLDIALYMYYNAYRFEETEVSQYERFDQKTDG